MDWNQLLQTLAKHNTGECRRVIDQCGKSSGSLSGVGRYIGGKRDTPFLAILYEHLKLTDHVVATLSQWALSDISEGKSRRKVDVAW